MTESDTATRRLSATKAVSASSEAMIVTASLIGLLIWLPLQTPVAVIAYQYLDVSAAGTRALLLAKDVFVAAFLLILFVRHYRSIEWKWYDLLAVGYVTLLVLYTAIPLALGGGPPLIAVLASFRVFVLPAELYGLGRLAVIAGLHRRVFLIAFVIVSLIAGVFTLITYAMVPASFWATSLNLVAFVREVQGLPNAVSLWDISILGHYGVGDRGEFLRAIGPFTHPVGTAQYFVTPLLIVAGLGFAHFPRWDGRSRIGYFVSMTILAFAVITPISRGAWLAAIVGTMALGFIYRRILATGAVLAIVALFLLLVPPFSLSIQSAISFTDASVAGHQQAVEEGIQQVEDNPWGTGVGNADHFGNALSAADGKGADGTGVGENMYLSLLVSAGPLGLLTFAGWMLGIAVQLWRRAKHRQILEAGLLAGIIGFSLSAMTASALMRFTTSATFWLLVGIGVALALSNDEASDRSEFLCA